MMPPFVVFPTNRIAHFVEVSLYLFYLAQQVNLINSDIAEIPESYILYNREYPWSSGSKSVLDWQWKTMELETGETKLVESIVEEPQFSWVDALLKAYSGEEGDVKAEQESEKKIDEPRLFTAQS